MAINGLTIVVFIGIFWGGIIIGYMIGVAIESRALIDEGALENIDWERMGSVPYKGRARFKSAINKYQKYRIYKFQNEFL
jgi:hypothetical protein